MVVMSTNALLKSVPICFQLLFYIRQKASNSAKVFRKPGKTTSNWAIRPWSQPQIPHRLLLGKAGTLLSLRATSVGRMNQPKVEDLGRVGIYNYSILLLYTHRMSANDVNNINTTIQLVRLGFSSRHSMKPQSRKKRFITRNHPIACSAACRQTFCAQSHVCFSLSFFLEKETDRRFEITDNIQVLIDKACSLCT